MAELTDIPVVTGEVLDAIETATNWPARMVFVGTVAFAGGCLVGWFVASQQLQTKYEQMYAEKAEEEIAQMRDHFRQKVVALQAREETKRPVEDVVKEAGYVSPHKTPPEAQVSETRNVFDSAEQAAINRAAMEEEEELVAVKDSSTGWDYTVEMANRPPKGTDGIFVIHEEEQDEKDYLKHTLTYYEGDDVLADAEDHILDNRLEVIGDNLNKFGHGSSDPKIVHIRNDHLATDFEVVHTSNKYAEVVHGFRHSDETFESSRRRTRHDE